MTATHTCFYEGSVIDADPSRIRDGQRMFAARISEARSITNPIGWDPNPIRARRILPFHEVDESDHHLITPGARFYLFVQRGDSASGVFPSRHIQFIRPRP